MTAKYILGIAAAVFLVLALVRIASDGGLGPKSRTWLIVAAIFATVTAWLSWREQ